MRDVTWGKYSPRIDCPRAKTCKERDLCCYFRLWTLGKSEGHTHQAPEGSPTSCRPTEQRQEKNWKQMKMELRTFVLKLHHLLICHLGLSGASLKPMKPNNPYSGRTAPLTSKRCILYIYSTNIGTEYFKHGTYSPYFPLQNAVCFIILTHLVPVLFTFYIECAKNKKK